MKKDAIYFSCGGHFWCKETFDDPVLQIRIIGLADQVDIRTRLE